MRRAAAWVVWTVLALAWFVQVAKDGDTLADGTIPGWQALSLSLSPLWGGFGGGGFHGNGLQAFFSVCSGLTNIAFVAGFARLAHRSAASSKLWARLLFASAAINTFWIIDLASPAEMRAGYWLWLASFVLLGLVAKLRCADEPARARGSLPGTSRIRT